MKLSLFFYLAVLGVALATNTPNPELDEEILLDKNPNPVLTKNPKVIMAPASTKVPDDELEDPTARQFVYGGIGYPGYGRPWSYYGYGRPWGYGGYGRPWGYGGYGRPVFY